MAFGTCPMTSDAPKRRIGRPLKVIDWKTFIRHVRAGQSNVKICRRMGIGGATLQRELAKDPNRAMEVAVARAESVGAVMEAIYKAALNGKSSAAAIFLRSVGRYR
jgi:nitrogen regulatory protein PII